MPFHFAAAKTTARATPSSSLTSAKTNSPLPPWCRTASTAALPFTSSISTEITIAPSAAKRAAIARPIPDAAPVTRTTRSLQGIRRAHARIAARIAVENLRVVDGGDDRLSFLMRFQVASASIMLSITPR